MAIEFQISGPKFNDIIRSRIRSNRPYIADEIHYLNDIYQIAWIDIGTTQATISTVGETFYLNTFDEGKVTVPFGEAYPVGVNRLHMLQDATVHLCSRSAMKQSNNDQAQTTPVDLQVEFELRMTVNTAGEPRLRADVVDIYNLPAFVDDAMKGKLLAIIQKKLKQSFTLSLSALSQLFQETPRVINAGIAAKSDLSVIALRFETEIPDAQASQRWTNFYAGNFADLLAGQEWSFFVPKEMIEPSISTLVEETLNDSSDFSLNSSVDVTWEPDGNTPHLDVTFQGEVIDACIGIDLDIDVTIDAQLSVPQSNVLRTSITISYSGDFWEELGCELVAAFFWPIVGAFFLDEGKLHWAIYLTGIFAQTIIVFNNMIGYMSTDAPLDTIDPPNPWVKDSATEWHQDQPFSTSAGGFSGLSLNVAAATAGGLILAGPMTVPSPLIPELKTTTNNFTPWALTNPCTTMLEKETEASIVILADPMGPTPRLPLRLRAKILNDPSKIYSKATYPPKEVMSSHKFTVKMDNPYIYEESEPYDLEVLILSNQGCRLITIPAPEPPPPMPTEPEAVLAQKADWMLWKATHCWRFDSFWGQLGIFYPGWMIDPSPLEKYAQHWWIQTIGGDPGDMVTLLDMEGNELMSAVTGRNGKALVTAVIEDATPETGVWLSRNGAQLSEQEYQSQIRRIQAPKAEPAQQLVIKQTLLVMESQFELAGPAVELEMDYHQGEPTVFLQMEDEVQAFSLENPRSPLAAQVQAEQVARLRRLGKAAARAPGVRSAVYELSGNGQGRVMDMSRADVPREIATFRSRPWYAGGARLGRLYARLDDAGRRVRIYRIGESKVGYGAPPPVSEVFEKARREKPSKRRE